MLDGKSRFRFHKHIDPKLREEIGDDPYDWMDRQTFQSNV